MSSDKVILAYGVSTLACLVAIAWQSYCDPWQLAAADEAKFRVKPDKMLDLATTPDMIATWFQWIKNVREIDVKRRSVGKRYVGQYMMGPLGPYNILLTVRAHKPGHSMTVEAGSWFRPRLQVDVDDLRDGGCNLRVSMVFNRTSALFQYSVGLVARQLATNWFRHSMFLLRMTMRQEHQS